MEKNSNNEEKETGNGYEYNCDGSKPSDSYMKWMTEKAKEHGFNQQAEEQKQQS